MSEENKDFGDKAEEAAKEFKEDVKQAFDPKNPESGKRETDGHGLGLLPAEPSLVVRLLLSSFPHLFWLCEGPGPQRCMFVRREKISFPIKRPLLTPLLFALAPQIMGMLVPRKT